MATPGHAMTAASIETMWGHLLCGAAAEASPGVRFAASNVGRAKSISQRWRVAFDLAISTPAQQQLVVRRRSCANKQRRNYGVVWRQSDNIAASPPPRHHQALTFAWTLRTLLLLAAWCALRGVRVIACESQHESAETERAPSSPCVRTVTKLDGIGIATDVVRGLLVGLQGALQHCLDWCLLAVRECIWIEFWFCRF